jgi:hypothetical protein
METVVNGLIEADLDTHIRGNTRVYCTPGDYDMIRQGLSQRSLHIDLSTAAIIITPNFSRDFVAFMDDLVERVPSMSFDSCAVIVFESDVQQWARYHGNDNDLHGSHRRRVSHWDSDGWQKADGAAARRVADAAGDAAPPTNSAWASYEGHACAPVDDAVGEPEWYYNSSWQDPPGEDHDGYPGPPPPTSMELESGDWKCPKCGDMQRKRNNSCNWCWKAFKRHTPKLFGSSIDPTKGLTPVPSYGGKGSSSESSDRKQSQG